jgi:hypothetical protein
MAETVSVVDSIRATFRGVTFLTREEAELQHLVARELTRSGIDHEEQVKLGPGERIDFMCGPVGLELKTKGGLAPLIRQLDRYAVSDRVAALVVLSTRRQLTFLPSELRGKPVLGLAVGSI